MAGRVHKLLAGNFHRIVAGYVHKLVAGYGTLLRDSKKLLPRHSCGHSCKTRLPRLTDPPGFGVMPIDWLQVMFINWQATSVNYWQVMSIFVAGYVHKLVAGCVHKFRADYVHWIATLLLWCYDTVLGHSYKTLLLEMSPKLSIPDMQAGTLATALLYKLFSKCFPCCNLQA